MTEPLTTSCGLSRALVRSASERRFVAVAAGRIGCPWVSLLAARGGLAAVTGAGAGDLLHLGRGVPQRRAELVDLELVDGPLLAFLGLVAALLEPAGDDDAHPALQALRDVLGGLAPHGAGKEQAVAVLPLPRRVVLVPGRARYPELGHRLPGRREPQLRVLHQVADQRHRCLVHDLDLPALLGFRVWPPGLGGPRVRPLGGGGGLPATVEPSAAGHRRLRVKRDGEKVSVCESFSGCSPLDAEWWPAKQGEQRQSAVGGPSGSWPCRGLERAVRRGSLDRLEEP